MADAGGFLPARDTSGAFKAWRHTLLQPERESHRLPDSEKTAPGPLHIQLRETEMEGYVLCEQVRYLDPTARRFSKLSATRYFDIMDISDAVVGMFERL